jgi:hypothetical protein
MVRVVEKVKLMRSLQEISKKLSGNIKIEIPSCELILVSPICSQAGQIALDGGISWRGWSARRFLELRRRIC